jgi:hypothetical protein
MKELKKLLEKVPKEVKEYMYRYLSCFQVLDLIHCESKGNEEIFNEKINYMISDKRSCNEELKKLSESIVIEFKNTQGCLNLLKKCIIRCNNKEFEEIMFNIPTPYRVSLDNYGYKPIEILSIEKIDLFKMCKKYNKSIISYTINSNNIHKLFYPSFIKEYMEMDKSKYNKFLLEYVDRNNYYSKKIFSYYEQWKNSKKETSYQKFCDIFNSRAGIKILDRRLMSLLSNLKYHERYYSHIEDKIRNAFIQDFFIEQFESSRINLFEKHLIYKCWSGRFIELYIDKNVLFFLCI